MVIFEMIPAWFYWVGSAVAFLLIYLFAFNDEQKKVTSDFVKKFGVWIGLVLLWLWAKKEWGIWQPTDEWLSFANKADTTFLIFALVILLGMQFLGKERYKSTQAVADNRSGSCAKYQEVGDYVVLNIGSCDTDMFPWYAGHETWVVPKRHFSKINGDTNTTGAQIICKTFIYQKDILELDPKVVDFIKQASGYHKENIFCGEFSRAELKQLSGEDIVLDGKKIKAKDFELVLGETRRALNETREMLKSQGKTALSFASQLNEFMKKAKGEQPRYYEQGPPKEAGY